jgi:hypothetical protein
MAYRIDLNTIDENLAELLTNTVNMSSVFYDIFLDPNPKDVELQMFDDNNELITVVIPNRAKDREDASLSGEGSPEGVIKAPIGTVYIDKLTSTIYYKVSGEAEDSNGWAPTISQAYLSTFLAAYLRNNSYIRRGALTTTLIESIQEGEVKISDDNVISIVSTGDTYGVVKIDNETIRQNAEAKVSTVAIRDDNTSEAKKIWIGTAIPVEAGGSSYSGLEADPNTIYVLTDTGQILVGNKEVACNGFPSNTSETLALGSSGDSYTAPVNGWFALDKVAGIANAKIEMQNTTTQYTSTLFLPATDSSGTVICPALKGEQVTITYTATGTTNSFIFINAAANRV